MSALVVCVSKEHGNTQKVAEAIARELDAEVVRPDQVNVDSLSQHDLIGFGSGIYYGFHYRELFDLVKRIPTQSGTRAFLFSTSGFGFRLWHTALRRRLVRKGFVVRAEHVCKALDTFSVLKLLGGVNRGHPDERDLEQAAQFARRLG